MTEVPNTKYHSFRILYFFFILNLSKCGILEITVTFCNAWSVGFCVIPKYVIPSLFQELQKQVQRSSEMCSVQATVICRLKFLTSNSFTKMLSAHRGRTFHLPSYQSCKVNYKKTVCSKSECKHEPEKYILETTFWMLCSAAAQTLACSHQVFGV